MSDAFVDVLRGCLMTAIETDFRAGRATVQTDDGQWACWAWQPVAEKWFCVASGVDYSRVDAERKADERLVDEVSHWHTKHGGLKRDTQNYPIKPGQR